MTPPVTAQEQKALPGAAPAPAGSVTAQVLAALGPSQASASDEVSTRLGIARRDSVGPESGVHRSLIQQSHAQPVRRWSSRHRTRPHRSPELHELQQQQQRPGQPALNHTCPAAASLARLWAVHQLVVSRYGRLQGHFRCKADGTIQNISCRCQTSQQLGPAPTTTSGLDAASAWQHKSRHLQFCFSILIMSGPLTQGHWQLVLQSREPHPPRPHQLAGLSCLLSSKQAYQASPMGGDGLVSVGSIAKFGPVGVAGVGTLPNTRSSRGDAFRLLPPLWTRSSLVKRAPD